jgi:(1->4)-alpha-D-glucan 1-alpha-D-glucosylmutase
LLEAPTAAGLESYRSRLHGALEKALREGKQRSNWAAPNREYEAAMHAFVQEALRAEGGFLAGFPPFVERIARLGVQNSLVQTALKLMAPGVPDIYQGCEFWDLSLVDPDNRRAVDYREREAALAKLAPRLGRDKDHAELLGSLCTAWRDGRIKLAVTALLLALRRDWAELFARGDYLPIEMAGENADWALGFVRTLGDRRLAVLAARFPAHREQKPDWRARAQMPEGEWYDVTRARLFQASAPLSEWLGPLPFAVLTQA